MATKPIFKDTDQGPVIRRKLNEMSDYFDDVAEEVGDVTEDVALAKQYRDEAEGFKNTSQTKAGEAATSATGALASKNAAATSATNAATSEGKAKTSETNAASSATQSLASKNAAGISETNSATSAAAALDSEGKAKTSETNSATSATNALASENKAKDWAIKMDTPVEGVDRSAKWYAQEAKDAVAGNTVVIHEDTDNIKMTGLGNPAQPLKVELVGWQNLPTIKPALNLDFINQKQLLKGVNFSRATPTWDYDEFGNFRKYEIDEPVFAYDTVTGEAKGLQVYPARTNLAIWSGDATNSTWSFGGAREGGQPSSLGGKTAVKLSGPSESPPAFAFVAQSSSLSFSFVCKHVEGGPEEKRFLIRNRSSGSNLNSALVNIKTGTIVTGGAHTHIKQLPNGFLGVYMQQEVGFSTGDSMLFYYGSIGSVPVGWAIIADYIQIEAGTTPTPYIPTEGSQVTVAATNLQIDGELFNSVYNSQQGTMLFDVGENYFLGAGSTNPYLNLGLLGEKPSSVTGSLGTLGVTLVIRDDVGVVVTPSLAIPKQLGIAPQLGNPYKLGISYTHDQQSIADFGEVATASRDASGFLENSASRIYVHPFTNGYVKAIKYYNKALPEATLKELTK